MQILAKTLALATSVNITAIAALPQTRDCVMFEQVQWLFKASRVVPWNHFFISLSWNQRDTMRQGRHNFLLITNVQHPEALWSDRVRSFQQPWHGAMHFSRCGTPCQLTSMAQKEKMYVKCVHFFWATGFGIRATRILKLVFRRDTKIWTYL